MLIFHKCPSFPVLQPKFGILFDVDGVLARGTLPLEPAVEGFKSLVDGKGDFKVPVTFVTNALNRNIDKANQIGGWLNLHVSASAILFLFKSSLAIQL